MAQKAWHSSQKTKVYHNNKNCDTGDNIEKKYMESGTGGKRLCKECQRDNRKHGH